MILLPFFSFKSLLFLLYLLFIFGANINAFDFDMKRQYRELNDETKEKISQSTKGKHKTELHKDHISQSMIRYWQSVPHRPEEDKPTTIQDLL